MATSSFKVPNIRKKKRNSRSVVKYVEDNIDNEFEQHLNLLLERRRKRRRKKYKFFNRGCITVYNNKYLTCTGDLPERDKKRARRRRKFRKQLAQKRKLVKVMKERNKLGKSVMPTSELINHKKETLSPSSSPATHGFRNSPPTVEDCNLEVQNWVITCDIETPLHPSAARFTRFSLDLHDVAIKLRHLGMQYNPERFHAVIRRFKNPSAAVLAFEGGAIVCTGAKTQERAELLVTTTIKEIAKVIPIYKNLKMKPGSWIVRNVVGSATMPFEVNLQRLYDANSQYSAYEPEIFPGATFRLSNPWARAILVFESGNLVITGAQSDKNLSKALSLCLPYIWAARKGISAEQSAKDMPKASVEEQIRKQIEDDAAVCMPVSSFEAAVADFMRMGNAQINNTNNNYSSREEELSSWFDYPNSFQKLPGDVINHHGLD